MVKKGDTLIEVTLAIGIFSMVAISVALAISGGTSGTQLSLETTLAREEVDTQAEVIRYIHDSYISAKASGDESAKLQYGALWDKIIDNAVESGDDAEYSPSTCNDAYNKDNKTIKHAFIINPRQLDSGSEAYIRLLDDNDLNSKTKPADTYPRLFFNEDGLQNDNISVDLTVAQGIYVLAAEGDKKDENGKPLNYDFYIRTCWYGTGNEEPSTISTVIRLYNPDAKTTTTGIGEVPAVPVPAVPAPVPEPEVPAVPEPEVPAPVPEPAVSKKSIQVTISWRRPLLDFEESLKEFCMYSAESGKTDCIAPDSINLIEKVAAAFNNLKIIKEFELDINKNYYFYIEGSPSGLKGEKVTITVTDLSANESKKYEVEKATYATKPPFQSYKYWNPFAYKNGSIVSRQKISANPQTNY